MQGWELVSPLLANACWLPACLIAACAPRPAPVCSLVSSLCASDVPPSGQKGGFSTSITVSGRSLGARRARQVTASEQPPSRVYQSPDAMVGSRPAGCGTFRCFFARSLVSLRHQRALPRASLLRPHRWPPQVSYTCVKPGSTSFRLLPQLDSFFKMMVSGEWKAGLPTIEYNNLTDIGHAPTAQAMLDALKAGSSKWGTVRELWPGGGRRGGLRFQGPLALGSWGAFAVGGGPGCMVLTGRAAAQVGAGVRGSWGSMVGAASNLPGSSHWPTLWAAASVRVCRPASPSLSSRPQGAVCTTDASGLTRLEVNDCSDPRCSPGERSLRRRGNMRCREAHAAAALTRDMCRRRAPALPPPKRALALGAAPPLLAALLHPHWTAGLFLKGINTYIATLPAC